ncbi:hypothetical protein LTR66_016876 [Elasticomyces elasticus]|nr:hypothetical protein LTR66_016876 [Elasticomyces elasticus]
MSASPPSGPSNGVDESRLPATYMHPTKSFRRKYRKIMVRFEDEMKASSSLFKDHQRLQDVTQRLAEQTDQLLSLLTELNEHPQIPPRLRYDLDTTTGDVKATARNNQEVAEELRISRYRVRKGEVDQAELQKLEGRLLEREDNRPQRSYQKLSRAYDLTPLKLDNSTEVDTGMFLSDKQKEQYLTSLDDFLDNKVDHVRVHAKGNLGFRHAERTAERERELQIANSVSVYNWLRKNQPQVFLQDPEHEKMKTGARSTKKPVAAKTLKQEQEMYDDDGFALAAPENKAKRKRGGDDDGGFRPKGGSSKPA